MCGTSSPARSYRGAGGFGSALTEEGPFSEVTCLPKRASLSRNCLNMDRLSFNYFGWLWGILGPAEVDCMYFLEQLTGTRLDGIFS